MIEELTYLQENVVIHPILKEKLNKYFCFSSGVQQLESKLVEDEAVKVKESI